MQRRPFPLNIKFDLADDDAKAWFNLMANSVANDLGRVAVFELCRKIYGYLRYSMERTLRWNQVIHWDIYYTHKLGNFEKKKAPNPLITPMDPKKL